MTSAYADLLAILEELGIPGVNLDSEALSIKAPTGGFDIKLCRDNDQSIVSFGDLWHEHFQDHDIAIEFVLIAITPGYRLVELHQRVRPVRATLQVADGDGWRDLSQTGRLSALLPWLKPKQIILQNTLADLADVRRLLDPGVPRDQGP